MGYGVGSIAPGPVDADDSDVKAHTLGALREEDGKLYMYVEVKDADVADGEVLTFAQVNDSDDNFHPQVTNDRSGGSSLGAAPAGVAIGKITKGNYGWILIRGPHLSVQTESGTNTDLSVGNALTVDNSNDGSTKQVSADDDIRIGMATASSATGDTSVEAFITLD